MRELLEILNTKKLSLSSVESMTGGLFASKVTATPGASKVFKGSIITYQTIEKIKLLKINPKLIEEEGVVSSSIAIEMAKAGKKLLGSDICISVTGNAGPTCEPGGKPVGRIYIAIAYKRDISVTQLDLKGNREKIRQKCVQKMEQLLYLALI